MKSHPSVKFWLRITITEHCPLTQIPIGAGGAEGIVLDEMTIALHISCQPFRGPICLKFNGIVLQVIEKQGDFVKFFTRSAPGMVPKGGFEPPQGILPTRP
jgi:hypothetical protein